MLNRIPCRSFDISLPPGGMTGLCRGLDRVRRRFARRPRRIARRERMAARSAPAWETAPVRAKPAVTPDDRPTLPPKAALH